MSSGLILCIVLCTGIRGIATYNMVVLGNERVAVSFVMIRNMFFLIPFVINSHFLDHVSKVIKNKSQ
jgi:hypothetical protein